MKRTGRQARAPASMKVPTRRWGNIKTHSRGLNARSASMKVPTRRWGNTNPGWRLPIYRAPASMKVPTRRWGNLRVNRRHRGCPRQCLNESPHPKVGKCILNQETQKVTTSLNESPHPKVGKSKVVDSGTSLVAVASMKVPTRRWGNAVQRRKGTKFTMPQ